MYISECSHTRERRDKGFISKIHLTAEFRFPSASKDIKQKIKGNSEFLIEYLGSVEKLGYLGKSFRRDIFEDTHRKVEITYPLFGSGFNLEIFCKESGNPLYNSENIFDLNRLHKAILIGT